jgi:hypothetical protein
VPATTSSNVQGREEEHQKYRVDSNSGNSRSTGAVHEQEKKGGKGTTGNTAEIEVVRSTVQYLRKEE